MTAKVAKSSNRGSKPGERRGGRKKGEPNKLTGQLKDMILTALHNVGGEEYLERQAESNPTAFMTLVGKVLPLQLAGALDVNAKITRLETVVVPAPVSHR